MKVRTRFVLTLTAVFSVILAISFIIIFSLYSDNRESDFNNRLWANAYSHYKQLYNLKDSNPEILERLNYYAAGAPANFEIIIIDSNSHVVYKEPEDIDYTPDNNLLENIKENKEHYFTGSHEFQGVGLYFNHNGYDCFVIATGYDKFGIARLDSLKLIMLFVSIGSIIILAFVTLYFVNRVSRPLINLSVQMRKVGENNLKHRVEVKGDARNNEIVRIATNFNSMLDRLEKAFNMQKNFVHHASHDLRTPLATMLSQTESALRRELTPAEAKKVLESLKEDQQGMIELTNALLLLSQYQNINYTVGWPDVRLDEVMYDSIASMQKMFAGITISFNFTNENDNEDYLCIKGNEVLLRSAYLNLLKNGIKYSVDNKVSVTMQAYADKVIINFENRGPVMQPEEVERMFFPFFRGENAQTKKGFGLGLSIVKRIVELHRCNISYTVIDKDINRFTLTFFHH